MSMTAGFTMRTARKRVSSYLSGQWSEGSSSLQKTALDIFGKRYYIGTAIRKPWKLILCTD